MDISQIKSLIPSDKFRTYHNVRVVIDFDAAIELTKLQSDYPTLHFLPSVRLTTFMQPQITTSIREQCKNSFERVWVECVKCNFIVADESYYPIALIDLPYSTHERNDAYLALRARMIELTGLPYFDLTNKSSESLLLHLLYVTNESRMPERVNGAATSHIFKLAARMAIEEENDNDYDANPIPF